MFDFYHHFFYRQLPAPAQLAIPADTRHKAEVIAFDYAQNLIVRAFFNDEDPGFLIRVDRYGKEIVSSGIGWALAEPENEHVKLLRMVHDKIGATGFTIMNAALKAGQVINTVKYIRELTGAGLVAAKGAMEYLRDRPEWRP